MSAGGPGSGGGKRARDQDPIGRPRAGRVMARFCLLFLLCVAGLGLLTSTPAAATYLHHPMARVFAALSARALEWVGTVSLSGTSLVYDGFGVEIVDACDGILPSLIYLAAVLAFPSRWRDKGWGILIGLPAIFLINLVRLITLMLVGATWPDLFEQVHIYVWQALVVALAMAVWVFWAERFVRARPVAGP